jgi:tetratricopeptide (TPR) repeat protein
MKNRRVNLAFLVSLAIFAMLSFCKLRSSKPRARGGLRSALSGVLALMALVLSTAIAQQVSPKYPAGVTIQGTVRSFDGEPVSDAVVRLEKKDSSRVAETKTNAAGAFAFLSLSAGAYQLRADKSELHSLTTAVVAASENRMEKVDLILQRTGSAPDSGASSAPAVQAMEFADQPNFTVAGVTDWTAVGGHGSDSTLRTSETLASETLALKSESIVAGTAGVSGEASEEKESESKLRAGLASDPNNFDTNYRLGKLYLHAGRYPEAIPLLESAHRIDPGNVGNQYDLALAYEGSGDLLRARERIHQLLANRQSADLYRLAGELDEKLGDPLSAVHEYEQAVKLNPSEQNYFEWGSELLLHRAVWQAQEVFRKAAETYPKSARIQTALGTALFAGARYDEAALRLCNASDLNPTDPNPYIFMGKIQMAAPNPLACVEPKLARFVEQQPESPIANYLYAMSILKHAEQLADEQSIQQAQNLLTKAVTIDSKCGEAYLQLGIIAASQRKFDKAISDYTKAIGADPQLADAHYRLGVAYDRTGQSAKAKQEFQLHDQIKQQQAEATERQRREVKQFLVVQPKEPAGPAVQ